jgi:hypothetical protein
MKKKGSENYFKERLHYKVCSPNIWVSSLIFFFTNLVFILSIYGHFQGVSCYIDNCVTEV